MHKTPSTAADVNRAIPSLSDPCTAQHGSLSQDNVNRALITPQSEAGHAAASAGHNAPLAKSAPLGATLNPNAQEFRPGASGSGLGKNARTPQGPGHGGFPKGEGLLAPPPRDGRGAMADGGSRGFKGGPQQRAHSSGEQEDRRARPAKPGRGLSSSPLISTPPRVTGWEVQAPVPLPEIQGDPPRSFAAPSVGGLSSALRSRASPLTGLGPPHGSDLSGSGGASGQRGRAVNANFLLNFKYEEHKRKPPGRPLPPRRREKLKPYNKELFLQANFRFLVSDLSDYSANLRDPDRMLDWEDVAAVEVLAPTPLQCPICLEQPPCCPQITLCGHIFCFPCLLRYLTQGEALVVDYKGDGPWKKCPLCFTLISVKDLRTVNIRCVPQYKPGDSISFSLLVRAKSSIIPFERTEAIGAINPSPTALCYSDNGHCALFAKFTLTSSIEGVTRVATQALTALADRTADGLLEDPDALPFIYAAMDHLQARAQAWADHRTTAFLSSSPPVRQRVLAQTPVGDQKVLGKSPRDMAKAISGAAVPEGGLEKGAGAKLAEVVALGESDITHSELKQRGGWVYEDAFSDAGSEESTEGRSVEARQDSVLRTIEEGQAAKRRGTSEEEDGSATESGSDQDAAGLGGFAPSEKRWRSKRLSKVPENGGKGGEAAGKMVAEGEEERAWYCFYQSSDGQPVFLHPLSMKCLLQYHGRYEALPPVLEAVLVEAESVTMATESTRKKYRYLSHLSLTGAFSLCEVDLRLLLPASAFVSFQEEIAVRERRRARAEKQEREQAARQAREQAQAAATANERARPPAPEDFAALLTAMEEADLEQALAASGGEGPQEGNSPTAASPAPSVPVAFSAVTKMGYASAYDAPALRQASPLGPPVPSASPPPRWGPPNGEPVSFAAKLQVERNTMVSNEPTAHQSGDGQAGGKKGKKGAKVLLSTGSARKY